MITSMTAPHTTLFVVYTPKLDACRRFYGSLGVEFTAAREDGGPEYYTATLYDGAVFELHPASEEEETGAVRLGFSVSAETAPARPAAGRHLLRDPDGRAVEITAV